MFRWQIAAKQWLGVREVLAAHVSLRPHCPFFGRRVIIRAGALYLFRRRLSREPLRPRLSCRGLAFEALEDRRLMSVSTAANLLSGMAAPLATAADVASAQPFAAAAPGDERYSVGGFDGGSGLQ